MMVSIAIWGLAVRVAAGDDGPRESDISSLVASLADRNAQSQVEACREIGAQGERARAAGGALVALMTREPARSPVWLAAADALEQVSPKVHTDVLTILLNDDRAGAARLGAARSLIDVGAEGEAALPALMLLWNEPSNNYKQATLLQALHAVGPTNNAVSDLILKAARGDLNRVLLGSHCRATAVDLVAYRDLEDDAINQALVMSLTNPSCFSRALRHLSERTRQGKAVAGDVAEVYLALIRRDAQANRTSASVYRELVALGADAKGIIPGLRELRTHPNAQIRREASDAIRGIEQSAAATEPTEPIGPTPKSSLLSPPYP